MSEQLHYGDDYKFIPVTSILSGVGLNITEDLYHFTIQVVNVFFIGDPDKDNQWVLVDAGMPKSANAIIEEAEQRFGQNARPKAILLTHGHFDHVGAIVDLVKHWNVPVYAHEEEIPFLIGEQSYPNPDPTVDRGLVARMSPYFPKQPIQLDSFVHALPKNGTIPMLPEWKWIPTPGHSPGHISLFRERDRSLIAGDAFVTVKQESLFKVFVQEKEISGPPKYFTTNWKLARESVTKLAYLRPRVALCGHGVPMSGEELENGLAQLVHHFDELAIPKDGRYVDGFEH